MMSGTQQNYSFPTLSVNSYRKLRVLSLTLTEGATIPASYGKLPNLKIMDFFGNSNDDIQLDAAMLSEILRWNISSLAFRKTSLSGIEPGAISQTYRIYDRSISAVTRRWASRKPSLHLGRQRIRSSILLYWMLYSETNTSYSIYPICIVRSGTKSADLALRKTK